MERRDLEVLRQHADELLTDSAALLAASKRTRAEAAESRAAARRLLDRLAERMYRDVRRTAGIGQH